MKVVNCFYHSWPAHPIELFSLRFKLNSDLLYFSFQRTENVLKLGTKTQVFRRSDKLVTIKKLFFVSSLVRFRLGLS